METVEDEKEGEWIPLVVLLLGLVEDDEEL